MRYQNRRSARLYSRRSVFSVDVKDEYDITVRSWRDHADQLVTGRIGRGLRRDSVERLRIFSLERRAVPRCAVTLPQCVRQMRRERSPCFRAQPPIAVRPKH